jgi:Fe-S cluster assembly iron-binding protein IscA
LSLEEQPLQADQLYTFDQLDILIHPNDYVYFHQTKLDYVKDVFGKGQYKLLKM